MSEAMSTVLLVVGVVAAVGALLTVRATQQSLRAQTTGTLTESAIKLLSPLQARIAALETEQARMSRKIADLEYENSELMRWGRSNYVRVIEMGGDPNPFPLTA